MTASASLDGGALGATERAFPALDGIRALAATTVVVTHAAFWTGDHTGDAVGRVLAHLDVGVAVFFVLSGFLLFRPFAHAATRGERAPSAGAYLWRRALRILPPYWLAVAAALILLPANDGADRSTWVRNLALAHIYDDGGFSVGLEHTWSLCVEAAFYLVLPFLAFVLLSMSRRHGLRPWPTLVGLGVLTVAGAAYLYGVWMGDVEFVPTNLWLPAFAGWFAGGMTLALLSVSDTEWGPVRLARRLGSNLGLCWAAAAVLFGLACTPLAGPYSFGVSTPVEAVTRSLLYMGTALLMVLPLVLAGPHEGPVRRALSSKPARYLGEISYGLFLFHLLVLVGLYDTLDATIFTGDLWLVAPIVWLASVAVAALVYVGVERPVRRWRSLVSDPASAGVPRRDGRAPIATTGTDDRRPGSETRPTERSTATLHELARVGDAERLAARLDAGASVDTRNDDGDSLLMIAAAQGHAGTVALLLARGADHSAVNDRGQTALGLAVFRQSAETVRQLLVAGADPDAGGPSARATAFYFGLPDMTALLEGAPR
ncbi:acyltransferase family protein [Blastococcus sp. TF02A-26]|uniref:acyltransferase family protein n=1 Tax=Blastococcus sp. TF02A-26 TaxID=2250577 RepID=UPI000DE9CE3E|nr:acyltransferase family protein [Blastococcus sp. TF02A-26]RBY90739.1 hypothetical protein DQ240_01375 [Blastococcus sp. TF02A-26]